MSRHRIRLLLHPIFYQPNGRPRRNLATNAALQWLDDELTSLALPKLDSYACARLLQRCIARGDARAGRALHARVVQRGGQMGKSTQRSSQVRLVLRTRAQKSWLGTAAERWPPRQDQGC